MMYGGYTIIESRFMTEPRFNDLKKQDKRKNRRIKARAKIRQKYILKKFGTIPANNCIVSEINKTIIMHPVTLNRLKKQITDKSYLNNHNNSNFKSGVCDSFDYEDEYSYNKNMFNYSYSFPLRKNNFSNIISL